MSQRLIPTNTKRNDCIQTPLEIAKLVVNHFEPYGDILEPCKGTGNFIREFVEYFIDKNEEANHRIYECEINDGKDFFDFKQKVSWIITNPPYSKIRKFMQHSMEIADNVVFLTTINHLWLKARIRDVEKAGFGIKEIILLDTPKNFPQSGFQIGCFHLQKNYIGDIKFSSYLKEKTK